MWKRDPGTPAGSPNRIGSRADSADGRVHRHRSALGRRRHSCVCDGPAAGSGSGEHDRRRGVRRVPPCSIGRSSISTWSIASQGLQGSACGTRSPQGTGPGRQPVLRGLRVRVRGGDCLRRRLGMLLRCGTARGPRCCSLDPSTPCPSPWPGSSRASASWPRSRRTVSCGGDVPAAPAVSSTGSGPLSPEPFRMLFCRCVGAVPAGAGRSDVAPTQDRDRRCPQQNPRRRARRRRHPAQRRPARRAGPGAAGRLTVGAIG